MSSIFSTRNMLLALGLLALVAGVFSAYDAMRTRPTDGAVWLLGAQEIRVVGVAAGGGAHQAGIEVGDAIEGIDEQPFRSPSAAAKLLQTKNVGDVVLYLVRKWSTGTLEVVEVELGSTRIAHLNTFLIYCGLGLIYFLAGLYLLWNNPHLVPARLFYLLCTLFLVYFFSASERSAFYYWSDLFTRNLGTLASLLLPPLFLHFFLVFPRPRTMITRHPWIIPVLYVLPILYYLEFTYTQFFGTRVADIGPLQQVTLGFYFTAGLASLVTTYITSPDPTLRQRVKILTVGTVLGTLPFLVFNIALGKLLGREDFALLGAIPMLLVPASFGYSIVRYRLMELEVIFRRSLVYATLTGLTVGLYLLIVVLVGNTVLEFSGQRSQLVAIIATLLIAAVFAPARDRIQSFLERSFFREKHDLQQALHDLAKEIPQTIELGSLVSLVRRRITALLHPTKLGFLLAEEEDLILVEDTHRMALPLLSGILRRRGSPLTRDQMASELARVARGSLGPNHPSYGALSGEIEMLDQHGLEVLVPAFTSDRLVGALGLGPKRSEAAYEGAELELLQIVSGQMAVQLENTRLYREAIARQRLEEEMAMARSIQQRMLPSEVPEIAGFEIAAMNLPSSQVSGDYYDFLWLPDSNLALVISDVSGKGMPASLLASNLQASIRALAASQNRPGAILSAVNASLYESTDSDRFATLFLASLCPRTQRLIYSNAGHNPPLLRRPDGSTEWLDEGATPLGAFPGMQYPEGEVNLRGGEVLVLFTDGVTEAEDATDCQFGEAGLERVVHGLASETAPSIVDGIREAVFAHSASANMADDMTVIVLRAAGAAVAHERLTEGA
jgi:sigma-B regulation protein RsbU (phosphoserine phosphatase)